MALTHRQQLVSIARKSPWFISALEEARTLELSSWCIGGGAVRNLVWDYLHGYESPSYLADIDVAYFDPLDMRLETEQRLQRKLKERCPNLPWEVTNQAAVHLWFEQQFGHPVEPLNSLIDSIASWPEYTTSVGITLHHDSGIEILAPHGLEDLFGIIVRRNPTRVSIESYNQRTLQKQYAARWPMVKVVQC